MGGRLVLRARGRLAAWLLLAVAAAARGAAPPEVAGAEPWVRVLVVEASPVVNLRGAAGIYTWDLGSRRYVATAGPHKSLNLRGCCGGRLLLGGGRQTGGLGARAVDGAPIMVNGQPYRGFVEVHGSGQRLLVVNVVALEDYLHGVVRGEVPPDWPLEALKAQAIVARTYAVYRLRESAKALWHLKATVESQVYRGVAAEDPRTSSAVDQTRGLVLARDGQPIPAFYHADSGGHTEDAVAVFPRAAGPHALVGVEDPHSISSPYFVWHQVLPLESVRRALASAGYDGGPIVGLEPMELSRTGRIQSLRVRTANGSFTLEGKRFRELLGYDVVRSTRFTATVEGSVARFIGRGWGHGVGLPQWGAKGMADLAYHAPEILRFYFPAAELQPLDRVWCC